MSTICVIGSGYVGLVTGTCFADMGNRVTCVDIVSEKIEGLKKGVLPIYEPGLEEMVERNVHAGRLHFTTSYSEGLDNCDFIFIAVNTPSNDGQGSADMRYVESAARSIAQGLDHEVIIINKSTVPVGSGDVVRSIVLNNLTRADVGGGVWSCVLRAGKLAHLIDSGVERFVDLPVPNPSDVTFGGARRDRLYVTSIAVDLGDGPPPDVARSLLVLEDLGVEGPPERRFEL